MNSSSLNFDLFILPRFSKDGMVYYVLIMMQVPPQQIGSEIFNVPAGLDVVSCPVCSFSFDTSDIMTSEDYRDSLSVSAQASISGGTHVLPASVLVCVGVKTWKSSNFDANKAKSP